MGKIDEDSIKKVLDAIDIVDIVGSYIPLKRAGSRWKACCPFHNEKTPSFVVDSNRQNYKCFGCGEGGSAIGFIMKMENLSFQDTVRRLAEKAGVPLIEEAYNPEEERRKRTRTRLLEAHYQVANFYHELLLKSPLAAEARAYLKSRGYGADMAKRWKIGWAPDHSQSFIHWANNKGINNQTLIDAGLASLDERGNIYARFRDRLMFPINNVHGECIAFSGRILRPQENTGKYVNSPETTIFKKGNVIFGLDKARSAMPKHNQALLCEGQLDVIACHEAGIPYAIAALGTAFTPDHAKTLSRYTSKVILCFDADKAGISASDRAFKELAPLGKSIYSVDLPEGDDPDSMIKREGTESFIRKIDESRPFFEHKVTLAKRAGVDKDTATVSTFLSEVTQLLSFINDPIARDVAAADIASRFRLSLEDMRTNVKRAVKESKKERKYASDRNNNSPSVTQEVIKPIHIERSLVILCELSLQNKQAQDLILDRIEELYEPMNHLPGGTLLKKILEKLPEPGSPTAILAFLETLPPNEAAALKSMHLDPVPIADVTQSVLEACNGVAKSYLKLYYSQIMAELSDPSTTTERKLKLSEISVAITKQLNKV